MPSCAAFGCTNRPHNKSKKQLQLELSGKRITFHRFPDNFVRRNEWIQAVRRKNWLPSTQSVLCSMHFEKNYFDLTSLCRVRLRENAVPTIFPAQKKKAQIRKKLPKKETVQKNHSAMPSTSHGTMTDPDTSYALADASHNNGKEKRIGNSSATVSLNKKRRLESPTKLLLTESFINLDKEDCIINELPISKERNKIAYLENVFSELRTNKLITEDQFVILKNISRPRRNLLMAQVKKPGIPPMYKYGAELRSFALTLNFFSPPAYNYVYQQFDSSLPNLSTLSQWYRVTDGNPGFTDEAFEALKVRAANSQGNKILCALIIDEMSLRRHVQYDGYKFYGYVDMGTQIDGDDRALATHAFVFLLVAINENWKVPVGYFLTDGMNAEQKKNLVLQCISLARQSGVRVKSLTVDGTSGNMALAEMLGCSFDEHLNLKTHFRCPGSSERVYVFPDPCRMLKLISNALRDSKQFECGGSFVLWKCIEKLHLLQGVGRAHKAHPQCVRHKMKVEHAAHLFGTAIADAIEFCTNDLSLPDFKNSVKTVEFLRLVSDVSDVLNSRSLNQQEFRKPMNRDNINDILALFCTCKDVFKRLTCVPTRRKLLVHNRRTGFLGFLICMNSAIDMYEEVVEEKNMTSHLPMHRISREHSELFFSILRLQGGWDNHPTALQFRMAYREVLEHTKLLKTVHGNRVPLEHISALHCSSAAQHINLSMDKRLLSDDILDDPVPADHDCVPDFSNISQFSENLIAYVAGFVVQRLKTLIKCSECLNALFAATTNAGNIYELVNSRRNGWFSYPSQDVFRICKEVEKVIRYALKDSGGDCLAKKYNHVFLTNSVMVRLSENTRNIFWCLQGHSLAQAALDNHAALLMKAVVQNYINVRLHYVLKRTLDRSAWCKQLFDKLSLFKGFHCVF